MKKAKIINFEWMIDTDQDIRPIILKYLFKEFKKFKLEGINTVIGLFSVEGILPWDQSRNKEYFEEIKKYADVNDIKIILLSGLGEKFKQLDVPFECYYTPYLLRLTFNNYRYLDIKTSHNITSKKFLFLGGCPTRNNRILLLSKFYENNLLDNADWSFFYPVLKEDRDLCRIFLKHYSDEEYDNFIKYAVKSPDQKYSNVIKYFRDSGVMDNSLNWSDVASSEFWLNPVYIDPSIFENTSFSIISEGPNCWSDDYEFITEKTWRTILYKHPFIFAGHPDQFRYLKNLGFKTFEEYFPIKDYAYIEDENKRLDAIVENVKFLINNDDVRQQMTQDVQYNFDKFISYANSQELFLKKLKDEFSICDLEFDKNFNTLGFENLITDINYD